MNSEDTTAVIDAASAAIDHSRWSNRMAYLAAASGAILLILGAAIWLDKPRTVTDPLCWLLVWLSFLMVVTPSAEQATKMLAQVSAIRAGVNAK